MSGLGLVEDELGVWVIAKPGEVDRRAHQIAGESMEPLGVAGIDRRVVMNAEAGMAPVQEQVDALLGDELPVSEKAQHLVAEEKLGPMGIDVGDGTPHPSAVPNASRCDGMDMRIPLKRRTERLEDGQHAGSSVVLVAGDGHHVTDGVGGESRELSQELSMKEEVVCRQALPRLDPHPPR